MPWPHHSLRHRVQRIALRPASPRIPQWDSDERDPVARTLRSADSLPE